VKLVVELPEERVRATVTMFDDLAPDVCRAIFESVRMPVRTRTAHACFDGHSVYCFLPPFGHAPPIQNSTMRPAPGDVMFFYAPPGKFAWMASEEDRLAPDGATGSAYELSFVYGPVDLLHSIGQAQFGSLVGHITDGFEPFAAACADTLDRGTTPLTISRS